MQNLYNFINDFYRSMMPKVLTSAQQLVEEIFALILEKW